MRNIIPAYWLAGIFIISTSATPGGSDGNKKPGAAIAQHPQQESCIPVTHNIRLKGYQYARPLILGNSETEDDSYSYIKNKLNVFIEKEKQAGHLEIASVYFKKLDSPSWFAINKNEEFVCASLFKVPVMIAVLMEEDKHPGYLDQEIQYVAPESFMENVTPLEKGKYYTLRQLVQSMISRSDNIAYDLCWKHMPAANFTKLLSDFQMKPFDINNKNEYTLSAREYSKFFRVLYNASYLSDDMSDFALQMLAESDFSSGLVKDIKDTFPVARKFGLRVAGKEAQLHEFGIFYFDHTTYLLGVMTKGSNESSLYPVLTRISDLIYSELKQRESSHTSEHYTK
jgi:hypothetical protein